MRRRGSRIRQAILACVAVLATSAGASLAQQPPPKPPHRVRVHVVVNHVSQHPGPIDPAAAGLASQLRQDFKYQSARVLETRNMDLAMNEVGQMTLPTGRFVKVRPRKLSERGVLMTVEVEGMLRTNLRVPNHHQIVIGAQSYEGGKLVITLEPEYQEP